MEGVLVQETLPKLLVLAQTLSWLEECLQVMSKFYANCICVFHFDNRKCLNNSVKADFATDRCFM